MKDYLNFLNESETIERNEFLIEEEPSTGVIGNYDDVNSFLQNKDFVSKIERAYYKIPGKFKTSIVNYMNGAQFNVDKIISFINEKNLLYKVSKSGNEPDFEEIMSGKNEGFVVTTFFLIVAIFLCYAILSFTGVSVISKFNRKGKRWSGIIIAVLIIIFGVALFSKTVMEPMAQKAEYQYVEQTIGKKIIDVKDTTLIRYGVNDKVKCFKLEDGTYYIGHF